MHTCILLEQIGQEDDEKKIKVEGEFSDPDYNALLLDCGALFRCILAFGLLTGGFGYSYGDHIFIQSCYGSLGL